jgi:hypothetical protein
MAVARRNLSSVACSAVSSPWRGHPDLKANQNMRLQRELSATGNQIASSRQVFNNWSTSNIARESSPRTSWPTPWASRFAQLFELEVEGAAGSQVSFDLSPLDGYGAFTQPETGQRESASSRAAEAETQD